MSWRDVGFLVAGLFVGANMGLLVMALCVAARRGDELAQSSKLMAESEERRGTGDGGRGKNAHGSRLTADREKTGDGGWETGIDGPETGDAERKVVFERKVVISKRSISPRKPTKKPSGPAPTPPPGPEKAVNE